MTSSHLHHQDQMPDGARSGPPDRVPPEGAYALLFENNPLPMLFFEPATRRILAVNEAAVTRYGYSTAEFRTLTIDALRPTEDRAEFLRQIGDDLEAEAAETGPWRHCTRAGEVFYVRTVGQKATYAGRPARLVSMVDVSREVALQRDRDDRVRTFEQILRNAPSVFYERTPGGTLRYVSASAGHLLDCSPGEARRPWTDFLSPHPENATAVALAGEAVAAGRSPDPYEVEFRSVSGQPRWVQVAEAPVVVDGVVTSVVGSFTDVTVRRVAEERLRLSDTILSGLANLVLVADAEGAIIYASPSVRRILGYEPEDVLGDGWWRLAFEDGDRSRDERRDMARAARGRRSGPPPYERFVRHADGSRRWIRWHETHGPDGTVITVGYDVTDQKAAETALRESEERFRLIMERAGDVVLLHDADGRILTVNEAACRLLGYARTDLLGRNIADLIAEVDRDAIIGPRLAALRLDESMRAEGHLISARNKQIPVEVRVGWLRVGQEKLVLAVARDVTDRRRAEAALRESEERFRMLMEQAADAFFVHSADGTIMGVNREASRSLGYTEDELIGRPMRDVMVAVDPASLAEEALQPLDPGESVRVEGWHRRKDGTEIPVETRIGRLQVGDERLVLAISRDVTERRAAEQALRASEERYRDLVDSAPVGVYRTAADGQVLFINRALTRMMGFGDTDDLEGRTVADCGLTVSYDRDWFVSELTRNGAIHGLEAAWRRRDGTVFHGRENVRVVRDPGTGEVLHFDGTIEDITERVEAERARRASEEAHRQIVEHAAYGIIRTGPDGRFRSANPAFARMLGCENEAEVLTLRLPDDVYVNPADRSILLTRFEQSDTVQGVEIPTKRRDGSSFMARLSGRVIRDDQGRPASYEFIVEDVSERRVLEAQLRQAQKMEAVGQLTGGIAHDFNNILTVVLANGDLLATRLAETAPDLRNDVLELQRAARRGADMIRKLLAFSRNEQLEPRPTRLDRLLPDTGRMLRRLLPETIAIRLEPHTVSPVEADPSAVEQMIMNLATNARDAMPDGGQLTVSLSAARFSAADQRRQGWGDDAPYVRLSVSDTGVGMDQATVARIYEPFFTTKRAGKGTGLGMAMIYGLMKQHQGFVDVESTPGAGTTVHLYFRCIEAPLDGDGTAAETPETLPHGSERILLVEDEPVLRRAGERLLRQFGYDVLVAPDGEVALATLEEQTVDLVITDVVMPRIGGAELARRLRAQGRPTRVLFTSGYAARDLRELEADLGRVPLLKKPWTLAELAQSVRQVLDAG